MGYTLVAFGIVVGILLLSSLLGPKRRVKNLEPYECGIVGRGTPRIRVSLRYYTIALLFLIFDVEVAFLFPWAVKAEKFGILGLLEVGFFVLILLLGFLYLWRRGGLDWE